MEVWSWLSRGKICNHGNAGLRIHACAAVLSRALHSRHRLKSQALTVIILTRDVMRRQVSPATCSDQVKQAHKPSMLTHCKRVSSQRRWLQLLTARAHLLKKTSAAPAAALIKLMGWQSERLSAALATQQLVVPPAAWHAHASAEDTLHAAHLAETALPATVIEPGAAFCWLVALLLESQWMLIVAISRV